MLCQEKRNQSNRRNFGIVIDKMRGPARPVPKVSAIPAVSAFNKPDLNSEIAQTNQTQKAPGVSTEGFLLTWDYWDLGLGT